MATKKKTSKSAQPSSGANKLAKASVVLKQLFKDDSFSVQNDPDMLTKPLPHFSSGSTVIDFVIGGAPNKNGISPCPGIPRGKIVQIWGANHSGKTTVCLEAAAAVIAGGGVVSYIDWEYAIDPRYASHILGVSVSDENHIMWSQPATLEEGFQICLTMAAAGVDLIVIDSVGSAVLKVVDESALKDLGNGTQGAGIGGAARAWGQFLPRLKKTLSRTGSTVIAISQTRAKIGMTGYGGPSEDPQGGKAWPFYADLRFSLAKVKTYTAMLHDPLTNKRDKRAYAHEVKITIQKCKLAPSTNAKGTFYIRYGEGIDDLWSMVDVAKNYGLVKGSGWLTWKRANGEEFKHQGQDNFLAKLSEDEALVHEFLAEVRPLLFSVRGANVDLGSDEDEDMDQDELLAMLEAGDDGDDDTGVFEMED